MKISNLLLSITLSGALLTGCSSVQDSSTAVPVEQSLVEQETAVDSALHTAGYTMDSPDVVVNPYGISPLTALVLFQTDDSEAVTVTVAGKDANTTYTNTFEAATDHELPIYGLYPDTDNQVTLTSGSKTVTLSIHTDSLPDDFILPESVTAEEACKDGSLYFYTPASTGYTCAYDTNGDVRWYLSDRALWDISRLDNGHLLMSTERLISTPYYSTGLYEMDLLGKIYKEYSLPGGYHHDYSELPNGNLLVLSNDFSNSANTVEDVIAEVDRNTGEVLRTIDMKDILKMDSGKNASWSADDWMHCNAVWYDEATDSITVSGRHIDAVVNLDYSSLKINWILGSSDGWDESYLQYFLTPVGDDFEWQWMQHAAMICDNGDVMLFDNGNNRSKSEETGIPASENYSRLVRYRINTEDRTVEQVYEYGKERGSDFYSPYISDVDELGDDHYLMVSGGISYKDGKILNVPASLGSADTLKSDTVELKDGQVIFEMVLPINTYRVEKMQLYGSDTYSLEPAEQLGSVSETTPDETVSSPVSSSSANTEEIYTDAGITLKQQYDRLVFSGSFTQGDSVQLILEHDGIQDCYDVPVVKKYYKAMCVYIPGQTSSEITVTKYVYFGSDSVKSHLYVKINDVTYDTGYTVNP